MGGILGFTLNSFGKKFDLINATVKDISDKMDNKVSEDLCK